MRRIAKKGSSQNILCFLHLTKHSSVLIYIYIDQSCSSFRVYSLILLFFIGSFKVLTNGSECRRCRVPQTVREVSQRPSSSHLFQKLCSHYAPSCVTSFSNYHYSPFVFLVFHVSKCKSGPWVCRWHDAGTYDEKKKSGGPNGSIRFKDELNRPHNKGLEKAVAFCGQFSLALIFIFDLAVFFFHVMNTLVSLFFSEEVKAKHPRVSYADLYQVKKLTHRSAFHPFY